MRKFWSKQSRPNGSESALIKKIKQHIQQAENTGNHPLLAIIDGHGKVGDEAGLKNLLNAIEKHQATNSNNNVTPQSQEMNTTSKNATDEPKDNSGEQQNQNKINAESESETIEIPEAEVVNFEPTPNIGEESQFQEKVINREDASKMQQQFTQQNQNQNQNAGGNTNDTVSDSEYEEPKDAGDTTSSSEGGSKGNLGDMPPHTKRKAINQTAQVFAQIYQNALPIIPKWVAKISDKKVQRMAWAGELDPQFEITLPDGTDLTIGQYIDSYNDSVESNIRITDEMKNDFQECLKAVMEEKQVAMTPSQNLIATVASHGFILLTQCLELKLTMNKQMQMFKEWSGKNPQAGNNNNQQQQQQQSPPQNNQQKQQNNQQQQQQAPPNNNNNNGQQKKEPETVVITEVDDAEEISINPEEIEVKP